MMRKHARAGLLGLLNPTPEHLKTRLMLHNRKGPSCWINVLGNVKSRVNWKSIT